MVDLARCLPTKVFCCVDMHPGAMILMSLIILFRFIAMIVGCFYGPYLYLVLPLGGLYLAADVLLLYTIFGSGLKNIKEDDSSNSQEIEPACDFKSQKIWIFIWLILNVVAILGLLVALGLFADLGWWSMTYDPKGIHVLMFFMVLILSVLLIYGQLVVVTLYLLLKDAWIRGILGNGSDEDMAGLTRGGKRIETYA